MNKKIIIFAASALLVSGAAVAVCFYWIANFDKKPGVSDKLPPAESATGKDQTFPDASQSPAIETADTAQAITDDIVDSLVTNPAENKPDINPVEGTNPIRKVKTNPFE